MVVGTLLVVAGIYLFIFPTGSTEPRPETGTGTIVAVLLAIIGVIAGRVGGPSAGSGVRTSVAIGREHPGCGTYLGQRPSPSSRRHRVISSFLPSVLLLHCLVIGHESVEEWR